jgi:hypothetical protein
MTGAELVAALRNMLDDENSPYKWQDSAFVRWLNEGEEQACRRGYALLDANTASICAFSVSVSVASYTLHSKVLQVRRLTVDSTTVPLVQRTRGELDEEDLGWVSLTGLPDRFVHEVNNELTLVGIPQSITMARMHVARLPLSTFSTGSGEKPEIDAIHHHSLMDWAMKRAYERRDADTQDMKMAQFYESRFTVAFGILPTARTERLRKGRSSRDTVYSREFGT